MFGGQHWTGGYNYLLNLFRTVKEFGTGAVEPILLVGEDYSDAELTPFKATGFQIVRATAFASGRKLGSLMAAMTLGVDHEAQRTFVAQKVDLVFEVASFFGWRLGIPAVAWIPDFQHRCLPHMFSRYAYWRRELGLRAQISSGRTIMLSSEDARKSCEEFFPASRGRTEVVRFAIQLDERLLGADPDAVRRRHQLPERFIYLPNQFWKHKNHRIVIDALAELKDPTMVVAATGQPIDPRHPNLYDELQRKVADAGLVENFRFLGMVPYPDVIGLMRAASTVINPSLFEGWSTTVEEARALGVPLILSDLAVHREQMGSAARYFEAGSATSLASALRECSRSASLDRQVREAAARADSSYRKRFYIELERAFTRALESRIGNP